MNNSGNKTTTVTISKEASEFLQIVASFHKHTKASLVTALVLSLATLDEESVSYLLSAGMIVGVMGKLGAEITYPSGMVLDNEHIKTLLIGLQTNLKDTP